MFWVGARGAMGDVGTHEWTSDDCARSRLMIVGSSCLRGVAGEYGGYLIRNADRWAAQRRTTAALASASASSIASFAREKSSPIVVEKHHARGRHKGIKVFHCVQRR
jgi:hypothetical protein